MQVLKHVNKVYFLRSNLMHEKIMIIWTEENRVSEMDGVEAVPLRKFKVGGIIQS